MCGGWGGWKEDEEAMEGVVESEEEGTKGKVERKRYRTEGERGRFS